MPMRNLVPELIQGRHKPMFMVEGLDDSCAARMIHPQAARDAIRQGAEEAMRRAKTLRLWVVTPPVTMDTQWATSLHADMVAMLPTVERTGDRSIRWVSPDVPSAYRTCIAAYLIARNADR
jgi:D-amino peptidase